MLRAWPIATVLLAFSLALTACGAGDDSSSSSSGGSSGNGGAGGTTGGTGGSATGGSAGAPPALSGWPLAIPEPDFGVKEEAPKPPDPWSAAAPSFYYVNNAHPAATDDANPQGTPDEPRLTIPKSLPAGATVFVAGGPYTNDVTIQAAGTAASPVFVVAEDAAQPPKVEAPVELSGSYLIVEHFDFNGPDSGVAVLTPSNHVAVRHSEVRNGVGGPGSGLYTGRWNPEDDPATAEHIVFLDNKVHDNGDVNATFDEDHHGIALGHHANHVWIVGNVMYRNSGDGLQINAKKASLIDTLHHVYVGKNVAYENKQTGLWSKQSTDAIFAQNVIYGHRPSNSSGGAGIGFQYGPERLWILFNEIHDCEVGISSSTYEGDVDGVPGPGKDVYVIGNLIHDIHKADGSGPSNDPWQTGAGIRFTDQEAAKHVENNTIYDADVAITYARGTGPLLVKNDILSGILGTHVRIETSEAAQVSSIDHELFDQPAVVRWGGSASFDVAGFQAAVSGQCAGCLEGNAAFVDASNGDFHLQAASPAVDSADASSLWAKFESLYGVSLAVDIEGTARPQGGALDRGAYELH